MILGIRGVLGRHVQTNSRLLEGEMKCKNCAAHGKSVCPAVQAREDGEECWPMAKLREWKAVAELLAKEIVKRDKDNGFESESEYDYLHWAAIEVYSSYLKNRNE